MEISVSKIGTQEWCVFQGRLNLLEVFSKTILWYLILEN